jgi:hypothetical protein
MVAVGAAVVFFLGGIVRGLLLDELSFRGALAAGSLAAAVALATFVIAGFAGRQSAERRRRH